MRSTYCLVHVVVGWFMAVNVLMRFRKGHCDLGVRFMCEVCVMYPGSARQGDVIACCGDVGESLLCIHGRFDLCLR